VLHPKEATMANSKNTQPQIRVVLRKPKSIVALLAFSEAIYTAMAANAKLFASPNPPLAQFTSDTSALHTAQLATATKTAGTAATRDEKLAIVETDLENLRAYVQTVANATPAQAASIAAAAGMSLRKAASPSKAPLTVKAGPSSGAVQVSAKVGAAGHVAHEWQYSTDGKTWTSAPSTLQGKTTITGLTPGSLVYVRHRVLTKTGDGDWDDAVSMIVS
jgi:hypothetical protein